MTVFVSLAAAAGLVCAVLNLPPFARPRLERRITPYLGGLHGRPSTLLAPRARPHDSVLLSGPAGDLLKRLLPASPERFAQRLAAAGLDKSPITFRLEQLAWGLIATLGSWLLLALATMLHIGIEVAAVPLLTVFAFLTGFLARDWWLGRQMDNRLSVLQEELPTAIDLLTLSIMSGESVTAAFGRIAVLLEAGIGRDFQKVVADVRAGSPVVEALEELKHRLPIPGISRFVDALTTGIERGAPLTDVLSAQADDGREARRRHLLEMGGRREVLMLIPVVFFIMPVVVVFALLPGLVSLDLLVP